MTKFRDIHGEDNTPIQQSMTIDPADYRMMNLHRMLLGVVLDVYPSDIEKNRSAVQVEDRMGYLHMCSVLVINDGSSAYLTLDNVIIPPDRASGVDDYVERLPRPTSQTMDGVEFTKNIHQIDPYSLDGDWCVVGFLGGQLDSPFIVSWWPHAKNPFDPATSGFGENGETLKQDRRFFERINGVEKTITSVGDVVISTELAGGKVQTGNEPKEGRLRRSVTDEGGSVRVYIKPSQTVEVSWDKQPAGVGTRDNVDPELQQPNPPEQQPQPKYEKENTFIYADRDSLECTFPGTVDVLAEGVLNLEGSTINHGADADEPIVKGDSLQEWFTAFTVDSPFGPLPATAARVQELSDTFSDKNIVE